MHLQAIPCTCRTARFRPRIISTGGRFSTTARAISPSARHCAGRPPSAENWGARSSPTSATQLHFWTEAGSPDLEVAIFAWRPKEQRLWWAEWYQEEERRTAGAHRSMFPVLSVVEMSWAPGERQTVEIVPGPRDEGRAMEWTLIDDVSGHVTARQRFTYRVPVTHLARHVVD